MLEEAAPRTVCDVAEAWGKEELVGVCSVPQQAFGNAACLHGFNRPVQGNRSEDCGS